MENAIQILGKNEFPSLLREINDPPARLHIRGKLPEPDSDTKYLAVVGSRKHSSYGRDACEHLIAGLRGYNIIIVSGLALGIDSIAHESALDAGLKTIAVPGSGLNWDVIYPAAHHNLAKRILASGGALVSEFENDFVAHPFGFPRRNRIMAGMSHAVLVIEADLKSGTLITAKLAAEYNRDVLCVPGSIFSRKSDGPHLFARLGAAIIRDSNDILQALGIEPRNSEEAKHTNQQELFKSCSENEQKLLKILSAPMSRDELVRMSGLGISEAIIAFSMLEMKGLILENSGEVRLA